MLDYLCPKESGSTCNSCTHGTVNQPITYAYSDRKPIDCLPVDWYPHNKIDDLNHQDNGILVASYFSIHIIWRWLVRRSSTESWHNIYIYFPQLVYDCCPILNKIRTLYHQEIWWYLIVSIRIFLFLETMSCWLDSNLEMRSLIFIVWTPTFYNSDLMKTSSCMTVINAEYILWWDMLGYFVESV